jgi:cardiolipin synthase
LLAVRAKAAIQKIILKGWSMTHAEQTSVDFQVLTNDAANKTTCIRTAYLNAINAAEKRILIVNSYFIPDRRFRTALYYARRRGVRVQVMVPGISDYRSAFFASCNLYDRMMRRGVEIYEYQPSVLHAKLAVVDDYISIVGTYNLDYRSWL